MKRKKLSLLLPSDLIDLIKISARDDGRDVTSWCLITLAKAVNWTNIKIIDKCLNKRNNG